jgi:hypothetical protein
MCNSDTEVASLKQCFSAPRSSLFLCFPLPASRCIALHLLLNLRSLNMKGHRCHGIKVSMQRKTNTPESNFIPPLDSLPNLFNVSSNRRRSLAQEAATAGLHLSFAMHPRVAVLHLSGTRQLIRFLWDGTGSKLSTYERNGALVEQRFLGKCYSLQLMQELDLYQR